MYVPSAFKESRPEVLHSIVRDNSFAVLVSVLNGELSATHMPFLLDAERGPNGTLRGHMARANPHWRAFESGADSMVIFQGPHAYISPSWYVSQQAVPTWNYTAVHVYGVASIIHNAEAVRSLLESTVATFEAGFERPWSTATQAEEYIGNLAKAIVAFEIPISRIEGKRKLSQNRPAEDVASAAAGLRACGDALGQRVAAQMLGEPL